jgi:uncharacterized protein YndB with AHSA1/START domain
MDDALTVTRDIDVELGEDELWQLVGDGEAWAEWMTDTSDVEVAPGGGGEIVDDGERRRVCVDDVVPGRRVSYRWWPADEPATVSTVELLIVPRPAGSTLRITETLRASASASASVALDLRWAVRAVALACHRGALVGA